MSLNMNDSFLFMNWVLDLHLQSYHSNSNDFLPFTLFLRNSLTPQLWERFLQSDSAIYYVQSLRNDLQLTLQNIPKKPRTKPTNIQNTPLENIALESIPLQVENKPAKKPRNKKNINTPLENIVLENIGVENIGVENIALENIGVESIPVQVENKPAKKPRNKKNTNTPMEMNANTNTPMEMNANQKKPAKKSRTNNSDVDNLHSKKPKPTKKPKPSDILSLDNLLTSVVGEDDFDEIQLQLVNVDGRDVFIPLNNEHVKP